MSEPWKVSKTYLGYGSYTVLHLPEKELFEFWREDFVAPPAIKTSDFHVQIASPPPYSLDWPYSEAHIKYVVDTINHTIHYAPIDRYNCLKWPFYLGLAITIEEKYGK